MSIEQRPPLTIQQLRDLSPEETTIWLVDLIAEGKPNERRILYYGSQSKPVQNISRDELTHTTTGLPPDEQRLLLFLANRLVAIGQREYGAMDVDRCDKDEHAEAAEEFADAVVYLVKRLLRTGKPSPLLSRAVDLMRDAIALTIRD